MRRSTVILCVVLALIPVVFCAVAVPVALVVRGIDKDEDRIDQKAGELKSAPPKIPTMTREQFREKVKAGMTPEQVIAAVGRPDETVDFTSSQTWFYRGRAVDTITGKVGTAIVNFEKGKVDRVTF